MRGILFAAVLVAVPAVGDGVASPASAGCETQPFAQYCDGPLRPDGTFERCQTTYGGPMYGQYGQVSGIVPGTFRCYPVNPAEPWPMLPLGQPQRHLWP